jgi:hypothetical protein
VGKKSGFLFWNIEGDPVSGCSDLGFNCEKEKEKLGVWKRQWVRSMKVECACFVSVFFWEIEMCHICFERYEKSVICVVL